MKALLTNLPTSQESSSDQAAIMAVINDTRTGIKFQAFFTESELERALLFFPFASTCNNKNLGVGGGGGAKKCLHFLLWWFMACGFDCGMKRCVKYESRGKERKKKISTFKTEIKHLRLDKINIEIQTLYTSWNINRTDIRQ